MEGTTTDSNIVTTILVSVLTSIIGGSGLVGLLFFFLRRYLTARLDESDAKQRRRREIRMRKAKIEEELHHAYGRVFFWMHRAITSKEPPNGELKASMEKLKEVEGRKKDLDREIIVENDCD